MDPLTKTASDALTLADKIEHIGVIGIMALVAVAFAFLFIREQRKNEALNLLIASNGKEMTSALVSMEKGLEAFTKTLDAVSSYIKELEDAVKDLKRRSD